MLATLKMNNARMKVADFKLSDSGGHPNKIPFKCVLFRVDEPSDGAPHGAGGKKIRISSSVCDKHLQTFVGMALNIDYVHGMSDHDPRFKVAVIEKAYRSMDNAAWVEGYIYGKDFPDVVATIRYYNGLAAEYGWTEYQFGASLEMDAAVQDAPDAEGVLDVIEFCGTGAAILFAEAAAYKTTSFAARKEENEEMKPEQEKAIMDGLASLTASVTSIASKVGTIENEVATMKAAATPPAAPDKKDEPTTELKAANDKIAALEKDLNDLKAAANKEEPQRKTFSASQMLSKYGSQAANQEDAVDLRSFNAAVDQLNLDPSESIKLKMKARKELAAKEEA